jgi:hypothetical protein
MEYEDMKLEDEKRKRTYKMYRRPFGHGLRGPELGIEE